MMGISQEMTIPVIDRRTIKYSEKYRALDLVTSGYWVLDCADTTYEYMSPKFWTTLGYDPDKKEHSPDEWQDIIHSEDMRRAVEALGPHLEDPRANPYRMLVRYKHREGHWVWILCRGHILEGGAAMLGIHEDMTDFVLQAKAKSTGPLSESGQALLDIVNGMLGITTEIPPP